MHVRAEMDRWAEGVMLLYWRKKGVFYLFICIDNAYGGRKMTCGTMGNHRANEQVKMGKICPNHRGEAGCTGLLQASLPWHQTKGTVSHKEG